MADAAFPREDWAVDAALLDASFTELLSIGAAPFLALLEVVAGVAALGAGEP